MTKTEIAYKFALQFAINNASIKKNMEWKDLSFDPLEKQNFDYTILKLDHKNMAINDSLQMLGIKDDLFYKLYYMIKNSQFFSLAELVTRLRKDPKDNPFI